MDHAFLWCATSVVAKLTMKDDYSGVFSHKVLAVKTAIHENIYEYDVVVNDVNYKFKYTFDSNTFARGKLEITQNGSTFRNLLIKKDMRGFKVYLSALEYIEFYSFNHKQLIGIKIVNNRKSTIASINIETNVNDEVREEYTIDITPAVPSQLDEKDSHLHMLLFVVNGVGSKDFHHCYDVVSFRGNAYGLIIFSDVTGQIICADTKLKRIQHEEIGQLTVINSDFKQTFEYVYDTKNKIYFVEERVEDRNNNTVIKDRISYREKKGIAYINEMKKYSVSTIDDNDVIFKQI